MKTPVDRTEMSCCHVERATRDTHPRVIDGPNGPVVASTGTPISDEDVRAALEAVRAREELADWIRTGSGPQMDLAASEQVKHLKLKPA
jgi:hypothetical protein